MAFRRLLLAAALLLLALPGTAGATGLAGWHPAAPLPLALQDATATTLPDGDVLVAGGRGPSTDGTAAFLYDPANDRWSATGRLETGRYGHTATPLDGGRRVLVVGGVSPATGGYVATAEVYDTASGTWSPAGELRTPRAFQTATVLRDGRVLVAGGEAAKPAYPTDTQVYDPVKNGWAAGGALQPGRDHAAAAFTEGIVVLAGGDAGDTVFGDSVLSTGATWSNPTATRAPRTRATATQLPDGTVLLAGGTSAAGTGGAGLASAETFDPVTSAWTATGPLRAARFGQTATLLSDGDVLVAGGLDQGRLVAGSELFHAGRFSAAGALVQPRAGHVAAPLDDAGALLAGGAVGDKALTDTERWTPPTTVSAPGALAFDGRTVGSATDVTLTLMNTGPAPLLTAQTAIAGPNAADFALVGSTCATTAPGGTCAYTVRFTPHAGGPRAATLTFSDNTAAGTETVALSGTGLPIAAIALSPVASTHPLGGTVTLTATLTEGGTPAAGRPVAFRVTAGPSQGRGATVTTGAAGTATFALAGAAPGTDTVMASFADSGGTTRTATAALTWSDIAALLSLGPQTGSAPAGALQAVTATLTEAGVPRAGRSVAFTVSAGPDAGTTGIAATGPDGRATFSFAGAGAGTDTVTATSVDSAGRPLTANAVTRTWTAVVPSPPDPCGAGQPDHDGDGIPDDCDTALPAGNRPVVAGSVARVALMSGEVFVKLPGGALADGAPSGFVPLKGVATIPMGSVVDARRGTLALTTAAAYRGPATQSVRLSASIFALRQARALTGPHKGIPRGPAYADLVLQTPAGAAQACAQSHKGVVRALSGSGAGHFRTVGAASTATVAGSAAWSVTDRCDGTLTAVGRGRVRVLDRHTHRARTVRAGQAFFVRARLFAARQR